MKLRFLVLFAGLGAFQGVPFQDVSLQGAPLGATASPSFYPGGPWLFIQDKLLAKGADFEQTFENGIAPIALLGPPAFLYNIILLIPALTVGLTVGATLSECWVGGIGGCAAGAIYYFKSDKVFEVISARCGYETPEEMWSDLRRSGYGFLAPAGFCLFILGGTLCSTLIAKWLKRTAIYWIPLNNFLSEWPKNRVKSPPELKKFFDNEYKKFREQNKLRYFLFNTQRVIKTVGREVTLHDTAQESEVRV